MQIITKVRHGEVDQGLKDYAEGKIGDKCSQFLHEDAEPIVCDIEFDAHQGANPSQDKRIDVTLSIAHLHSPIHIEEADATFEEAINKAVDRLDQPLSKFKETKS